MFLLLLDHVVPHLHRFADKAEGPASHLARTTMMVLAVTIHNIPEGMAVGIVYAGFAHGTGSITAGAAMALSLGIAIQNFPEGAIISMPLHANGQGKWKAFLGGVLSGAVEPVGALAMIAFASVFVPTMPYLLSFAAGAMMYVVVEELIPEMSTGEHSNIGVLMFAFGFTLMMALDVALGWFLMVIAAVLVIGAVILAVWDGVRRGYGFLQFFLRFLILLEGYKVWDMIFLDWYLLTKSHFYQHYFPEVADCESLKHTGFNRKQQLLKLCVVFPVIALVLGGICSLIW